MSSSFNDFNRNLIKDLRANGGKATSGPFKGRDVLILTTTGAKSGEDLRANGGKATSGPFKGRDVLILTTTGARSGEDRETPLVYTWEKGHHVIVASKGGAPTHPSWYHNLQKHPIVTVEASGEKFKAHAKVVDGDDYERLYKQHADINPGFWDYRQKTTRKIPVILLERIDQA